MDNITIRFNEGSVANYFPDTSSSPLWQIGNTTKYFFSSAGSTIGIMTDTLHPYPVNANNSFIITVSNVLTSIISVWHRYQTDSLHAGGIIEFSVDSGLTWQNVQGLCNKDSTSGSAYNGTYTNNFYSPHNTYSVASPVSLVCLAINTPDSSFTIFLPVPVIATLARQLFTSGSGLLAMPLPTLLPAG